MLDKFIEENILAIVTVCIAFCSFIIARISLLFTKNNSRSNSYNSRGNFSVYFKKNIHPSFEVKIYNSVMSDTIPFDYTLQIESMVGGIFRTHCFNRMDDSSTMGAVKSLPIIKKKRRKNLIFKKYAHDKLISFSSDPFYCYFETLGKYDKENRIRENKLNRYHNYIEITDYCGNTEIWYFSFSLHLSNLKKDIEHDIWEKCNDPFAHFKYYRFSDFTIMSPKDLPMNLRRTLKYEKNLSDIREFADDFMDSKRFIERGYRKIEYELQLYELREYHEFLQALRKYKYI